MKMMEMVMIIQSAFDKSIEKYGVTDWRHMPAGKADSSSVNLTDADVSDITPKGSAQ